MRHYGRWAGRPKGVPEDTTRCIVSVGWSHYIFNQCSRKRGHGKDGLFCAQHAKKYPTGKGIFLPEDNDE